MKNNLLSTLLLLGSLGLAEKAAAQTQVFVQWPLRRNNADSAAVRSAGVTAGTPTFKRYVLSNGQLPTGAAAFAPYSSVGQAFGVLADGSGWSSNATPPGPGSAPKRIYYEQFTVTATAPFLADSLILSASVASSAAGKMTVVYSRSGFTTDSTDVTGGKGPTGALPSSANATFGLNATSGGPATTAVNGALLPQYVVGGSNASTTFRLALNGATGLVVPTGQTLSLRIYFGVGSTGIGRYILLRGVTLKSKQVLLATRAGLATTNLAAYPNPVQNRLTVPHTAASRDARLTVFSATGARVATLSAQPGTTETAVDLSSLSRGLYLIEYADGSQRSSARVIKE